MSILVWIYGCRMFAMEKCLCVTHTEVATIKELCVVTKSGIQCCKLCSHYDHVLCPRPVGIRKKCTWRNLQKVTGVQIYPANSPSCYQRILVTCRWWYNECPDFAKTTFLEVVGSFWRSQGRYSVLSFLFLCKINIMRSSLFWVLFLLVARICHVTSKVVGVVASSDIATDRKTVV